MFGVIEVFFRIFPMIILLLIIGCSHEAPVRESGEYEDGAILKSDKDTPIPRNLVTNLEKQYIQVFRKEKPDSPLTDLQLSLQVPRRLMQISVFLKEQTPGTMLKNARYQLPQGGGTIDLAEIINEGKGIFKLDFQIEGLTEKQHDAVKVYFVSNSKRFEVHGKTFGVGCGKYLDVTRFFHTKIQTHGMELAAADYRYLGQLLGSFFFTVPEADALYVGSASFVDSRYKDSHCVFPES